MGSKIIEIFNKIAYNVLSEVDHIGVRPYKVRIK